MKMINRYIFLIAGIILCVLSVEAQQPEAQRIHLQFSNLTNLHQIDSDVYRSDQPDKEDFKALEKFGIKEILNIRFWHSDKKAAEGTDLTLHHIRTNAFSINEKQLIEIMRIIRDRKGPILIHCYHGSDRTGAVIALYRMVFQHVPKADAIREMKEGGFGHHAIFFNITRTLERIDVENVRSILGLDQ